MRAGSGRNRPDPARKLSANLYDIYHCCMYSEKLLMMDRGTVRKHVEFYSKNKYEILVHVVGFIIIIYHDTRSPERQIRFTCKVPYIFGRFEPNLKFLGRCFIEVPNIKFHGNQRVGSALKHSDRRT